MRARVGGNIGVPLSEQVEDSTPDTVHVVEMSSFQLESTDRFHPWVAALLNFSPDHLDRHTSVEAYAAAKARVFRRQQPTDWAVVNSDDSAARVIAAAARSRRRWFGFEQVAEGVTVAGDTVVERSVSWRSAARAALGRARPRTAHPERRARGVGDQPARRRDSRGHHNRRARVYRARARHAAGRRRRGRALRQRLQGHEHRLGEALLRERALRARGDSRRPLQGWRLQGPAGGAPRTREGVRSRLASARRASRTRSPTCCPCTARARWTKRSPSRSAWRCPATRWCLRPRVRASTCSRASRTAAVPSRTRSRGCGSGAHEEVSSEQSSVETARLRAGCWERGLPRPAKLVSQPRSTDDR